MAVLVVAPSARADGVEDAEAGDRADDRDQAAATGAGCKDDGWRTMSDASGNPFKNQGACVSFYAKSGATPIGN